MIFNSFLFTITLVDGDISLIANILNLLIFYIYLIYNNKCLKLWLALMPFCWLCKYQKSAEQTYISFYNYSFLLIWVNYMIIVTYFKMITFFYYWVYLISPIVSSTSLIFFIFFTFFNFPIFSIFLTFLILCSPTLGTKRRNIMALMNPKVLNLGR